MLFLNMYITREIELALKKMLEYFPVVSLSGPRQSGKTTVLKKIFPDFDYINLEFPVNRKFAQEDPVALINNSNDKIFFDEIQKVPELLSYIQYYVDEGKKKFIISGSQNLLLNKQIAQSLAGRVGVLKLLPLSLNELKNDFSEVDLFDLLLRGFYPRVYENQIPPNIFYQSYISTYVEKDIKELVDIKNINQFSNFFTILSGRIGQTLNYSSLASDIGVSPNTVKSWISILEKSYLIYLLRPYFRNHSKRIAKMPKLYFTDIGLAINLLRIQTKNQLKTHPLIGNIFENFIVIEYLKKSFNQAQSDDLYFWRDSKKREIDLILEKSDYQELIEIKFSETFNPHFLKNINFYKSLTDKDHLSKIIYRGNTIDNFKGSKIINWKEF